ncbi:MAG: sulfatase, partial [Ignavibacteriae bacterium]|nr:sulfatase [Ignavibacteriota bacterium]
MIRCFRHSLNLLVLLLVLTSCGKTKVEHDILNYSTLELPERPNIVWIVAEDLSPYIPTFGDSTVQTPNISRLAKEGITYSNLFSPSGVCAPSRAAIATGMYPTRIGAQHMRTGPWFRFTTTDKALENYAKYGRLAYEAMPPDGTHMLSTYLREAGYYCINNPKEDYQFRCEMTAWDESGFEAHWKNRKKDQPFFAIFNIDVTHESMIWRKLKDSLFVDENLDVPVPPYLPDTDIAKQDIRRMYSNIVEMDIRVGEILKELEDQNLLENTIVFWYTDHGGPMPRQKRTVFESGIHVPMIVRFPNKQLEGKTDDQLLSFIDLMPTTLSSVGIQPPLDIDGKAWLGEYKKEKKRKYIFAAADRFDNETDRIRAVRDHQFKLIKNYNTNQSYYLPIKYREEMPIMHELLKLEQEGKLTKEQKLWFKKNKDSIELYDILNDPHELNNLARNKDFKEKIAELSSALDEWIKQTNDKGMIPEQEYIESIWPNGNQLITESPEVIVEGNKIILTTSTREASIG